ncbi:MAG: hypothetical protein MnENMB40S_16650 [Rhizobiaceae bacterium MnEN-MB40S]|nr:MAG: hypothetical protein MnENMB40S_16650 [Rhizobiaceae bacterium MnEN-MB40S]
MTVLAIAQISIHDRDRYKRYADRFLPTLGQYGGRLLAADEHPEVVEGELFCEKLIVLSFPSRDAFQAWVTSEQYREIAIDRLASTTGNVLLVQAIDPLERGD